MLSFLCVKKRLMFTISQIVQIANGIDNLTMFSGVLSQDPSTVGQIAITYADPVVVTGRRQFERRLPAIRFIGGAPGSAGWSWGSTDGSEQSPFAGGEEVELWTEVTDTGQTFRSRSQEYCQLHNSPGIAGRTDFFCRCKPCSGSL
jgi:hypothetical protein